MTWFRRPASAPWPPAQPAAESDDSPVALLRAVFGLNRFINQNSGRLPGEAVVAARLVTDTLREVIETAQIRPLDVYAVISVKACLTDYLPTTLSTYLALDEDLREVRRRSRETPTESLLEQIDVLHSAAAAVLLAAHEQDADALMTQGRFLATKFSGSDLDL